MASDQVGPEAGHDDGDDQSRDYAHDHSHDHAHSEVHDEAGPARAGHGHGLGHHHHHGVAATPDHRRKLAIAFGITTGLLVAQFIGAILTGSLALLTDTAHMFTDSVGLGIALVAATLALRPASSKRTWGFRRIEVLAAQAQAGILAAVALYAAYEGVMRLMEPPDVPPIELLIFGVIGLAGNLASVAVLSSDRTATFNMRAAFLEAASDALGSVGVVVAALVIALTGWQRADAIAGLAIAALIVPRAFVLLRDTAGVLMEFTPPGLNLDEVREHILGVEHVRGVHELHASVVASGLPVLSAHVVIGDGCFRDGHAPMILREIKECVSHHFEIDHSTIELEPPGFETVDPQQHA